MTRGSLTIIVLLSLLCTNLVAQDQPTYCKSRKFKIPLEITSGKMEDLAGFNLFVSVDEGRTWKKFNEGNIIPKSEKQIPFSATQDAAFWFVLQSVQNKGPAVPPSPEQARPEEILKIVVDTQKPFLRLASYNEAANRPGVSWQVIDDFLDPAGVRLEYQTSSGEWVSVPVESTASGSGRKTLPPMEGPVLVRITARDYAGNTVTDTLNIGGKNGGTNSNNNNSGNFADAPKTGNNSGNNFETNKYQNEVPTTGGLETRYVRVKKFNVNFDLEDVGPSGAKVYVFYTNRQGGWQECGYATLEPGQFNSKIPVELPNDGAYGLTILARTAIDVTKPVPSSSLRPQMYVVVDGTKPVVSNVAAEPGRGNKLGTVNIRWSARDDNLTGRPITIQYSSTPTGPWQDIITEYENIGRYEWNNLPNNLFSFYIRVVARDKARNENAASTPDPVKIDIAQPKGRLIDIEETNPPGG